jgi:hypothetical protein
MSLNELKTMPVFEKTRTMPVFGKTCPTETIISFGKQILAPRQPSGDGKKFPIDIIPMVSG